MGPRENHNVSFVSRLPALKARLSAHNPISHTRDTAPPDSLTHQMRDAEVGDGRVRLRVPWQRHEHVLRVHLEAPAERHIQHGGGAVNDVEAPRLMHRVPLHLLQASQSARLAHHRHHRAHLDREGVETSMAERRTELGGG